MFKINGILVKENNDYLQHPRTKITTTIRSSYWKEYQKLCKLIGEDYCKGFDIMLELISEDEMLTQKFVKRLKNY